MKASHRRITELLQRLKLHGIKAEEMRRVSAGLTTLAAVDLIALESVRDMCPNDELLGELLATCRGLRGLKW
jgi:hypothetical protein